MDIPSGLILGFIYAAAPGPISIETLRQGVKGGFLPSLAVQAGSVLGLLFYALLALLGAEFLLSETKWQLAFGVGGTAVLLYLGITTIRNGRALLMQTANRERSRCSTRHAFGSGAVLSLANPLEIVFWLSLNGRMLHNPGTDRPIFLTAFFSGCIAAALVTVLLASFWHGRVTAKAALTLSWICGLALIAFGLKLGLTVGQYLIQ